MVEERRLQGRDQPFQRITRQGGLGKKVKIAENVRLIGTSNGKQVGIKVAVRRGMGGKTDLEFRGRAVFFLAAAYLSQCGEALFAIRGK